MSFEIPIPPSGELEWPYYLYTFVSAAFVLMFVIYIPMWVIVDREEKRLIKQNSTLK